ncbi:MAG: hypothetical protein L0Z51_02650 [Candidatus Latescibacteria bacterium]|nr:hypothetical protein [Candidatus Latescibacterota bacterium]
MRLLRAAAQIFCIIISMPSVGRCGQDSVFPPVYEDPLIWDDLVVKGNVSKTDLLDLTPEQWFAPLVEVPKGHGQVQLIEVHLTEIDVLRGFVEPPDVIVVALRPRRAEDELSLNERVRVGEAVFVTARYRADKGLFVASTIRVRESAGWQNVLGDRWRDPISETQIRSRVESASVSAMTRESDLVLRGRVVAHRKVGPEGASVDEYEVEPDKMLKGTAGQTVTFLAGGGPSSSDESRWRLLFTEIDQATTWYFFLKRQDSTYVPTAGWRAAFRVLDGRLFERRDVPSSYTPDRLERVVMQFSNE